MWFFQYPCVSVQSWPQKEQLGQAEQLGLQCWSALSGAAIIEQIANKRLKTLRICFIASFNPLKGLLIKIMIKADTAKFLNFLVMSFFTLKNYIMQGSGNLLEPADL